MSGDDGQLDATVIVTTERLAVVRGARATPFGRQLRAPSRHPALGRVRLNGAAVSADCKVEASAETYIEESYRTHQQLKPKQRHKDGIVTRKRPRRVEQVFDV